MTSLRLSIRNALRDIVAAVEPFASGGGCRGVTSAEPEDAALDSAAAVAWISIRGGVPTDEVNLEGPVRETCTVDLVLERSRTADDVGSDDDTLLDAMLTAVQKAIYSDRTLGLAYVTDVRTPTWDFVGADADNRLLCTMSLDVIYQHKWNTPETSDG